MTTQENQEDQKETVLSFAEFLESLPPNSRERVTEESSRRYEGGVYGLWTITPEIQLYCASETCNGIRFFRCTTRPIKLIEEKDNYIHLQYVCSNCRRNIKTFSLCISPAEEKLSNCFKLGEYPAYGPPTPSRLISLIGPDRDIFLKGRRCENQGLGVGAFAYYRRVVENQKNRILGEIIKVSKKLNIKEESLALLEEAKAETQFSKAISSVKSAIPQALLINGHNPLTLLHSALSDGLHDRDDDHCLELASSIRVILGELSERLSMALKDEAEINNALSKLLAIRTD